MILEPRPGKAAEGENAELVLHSAPGPAQPGDFVAITTSGVAQARADANQGPILVGDRLALSNTPGHAAQAQVLTLDGVSFYAPGGTIGSALTSLDAGTGLIWVFVDPR
jgi:hypothetical protein